MLPGTELHRAEPETVLTGETRAQPRGVVISVSASKEGQVKLTALGAEFQIGLQEDSLPPPHLLLEKLKAMAGCSAANSLKGDFRERFLYREWVPHEI